MPAALLSFEQQGPPTSVAKTTENGRLSMQKTIINQHIDPSVHFEYPLLPALRVTGSQGSAGAPPRVPSSPCMHVFTVWTRASSGKIC